MTARNSIPFETLQMILDEANLYDEDFGFRASYKGRGYGPEGFGLTVGSDSAMARFMVAAGMVAEQLQAYGQERLDAMALAEALCTDSMGLDMIIYWPDWTVTDVPADYGNQH